MNKKSKLLLLLAWVLAVNAYGQIQQMRWYLNSPMSTLTNSISSSSSGLALAESVPTNPFTNYIGFNAAWDSKGRLLFYVVGNDDMVNVYNATGALKLSVPMFGNNQYSVLVRESWASKEIPIIRIGCGLEYHILIAGNLYYYNIMEDECTNLLPPIFKKISVSNVNIMGGSVSVGYCVSAISKHSDTKYSVYSLDANSPGVYNRKLKRTIIDVNSESFKYTTGPEPTESVDITAILPNNENTSFVEYCSVMEVSPDKSYLAFADEKAIIIYNLLPDGSIGTMKCALKFELSVTDYKIAGLEFNNTSTKLVFTRFNSQAQSITTDDVGVIDLTNSTPAITYLPFYSGQDYAHSEIEMASNGKLYLSGANHIAEIDLTTNTIIPSFATPVKLNNHTNASGLDYRVRVLPDQIDGVDNSNGFSLKIGSYSTTRNESWANGANPFGVVAGESITVRNSITINHEVIVTGMNFDFYTDAAINIGNGGRLVLRSCNLKSFECGKMWNGINITGTGKLVINDNYVISTNPNIPSTTPSSIADAKIAVKGTGLYFKAQIHQTNFLRNGKGIYYTNFDANTDIIDFCTFDNTGLLKNQDATSNGINIPFYGGWVGSRTMEFGWTSPGTWMFISDNKVNGGTFGIFSSAAAFYVRKCEFKNMIEHGGIAIQATLMSAPKFADIQDSKFSFVKKAFRIESGSDVKFISNTIQYTEDNAVELLKGRDCKYQISKNYFLECKNNAVLLQDNAGVNSVATIDNNTILGKYIATSSTNKSLRPYVGISVFEKGKVKGVNARTFGGDKTINPSLPVSGLQILNNTMRAVTFGVKMSNVVGAQTKSPNPVNQTSISANTIRFSSTLTPTKVLSDFNSAMELTLTDGIAITSNTIDNHDYKMNKIWNNKGVYLEGTTKVLVRENTIKAGRGIGSNETASDNNYTCNILADNHNGISLGNHSMRAKGDVHGLKNGSTNIESRNNTFISVVNSEIELWTSPLKDANGKVILTDVARMNNLIYNNQWIFYTGTTPKITYRPTPTGSLKTIHAGYAKDICGGSNDTILILGGLISTGDVVLDWQHQYEWIKEQKNNGISQTGFISQLIDVQALISDGSYTTAYDEIGNLNASNIIEENFKTVYSIIVQSELENNGLVDSPGIGELTSIASQNPSDVGPSVYLARGILWCQLGLEFNTETEMHTPVAVQLKYEGCIEELPVDEISAQWVDEYGTVYNSVEVGISLMGTAFTQLTDDMQLPTNRNYAFRFTYQNQSYFSNYLSISEWLVSSNQQVELCALGKQGSVTGVEPQLQQELITLYPNPGTGVFTLTGMNITGLLATVVDVNGRIVHQATIGATGIDLTDKPDGMYYLRITDSNGKVLHRQSILKTN